jgi:hypothetical protein
MPSALKKALAAGLVALAIGFAPGAIVGPASAGGNMGDPSAPMRANAAAYPEFFAPYAANATDPAYQRDPPNRPAHVRACKVPAGVSASVWNCRQPPA